MKKLIIIFLLLIASTSYSQWSKVNGPYTGPVSSIKKVSQYLFALTNANGIFRSSDNGISWLECNNGITNSNVTDFISIGENIYAGTYGAGVFKSGNLGNSWSVVEGNILSPFVTKLASTNNKLLAGTVSGLLLYEGDHWKELSLSFDPPGIYNLITKENNIYIYAPWSYLYKSTNEGLNWVRYNMAPGSSSTADLTFKGDYLYTLGSSGVYRCHKDTTIWRFVSNPFGSSVWYRTIYSDSNNIYVGNENSVFKSTNSGVNFISIPTPLINNYMRLSFFTSGNELFIANQKGILFTQNAGANWSNRNSGIINSVITAINIFGNEIFAVAEGIAFRTFNNGSTWETFFGGFIGTVSFPATCVFRKNVNKIFIPTNNNFSSILRSSNNGANWINGYTTWNPADCAELNGEDVIFGTDEYLEVFHDTSPYTVSSHLVNSKVTGIYKSNSEFFVSTDENGIYKFSSDYSFQNINTGLTSLKSNNVSSAGNFLYTATGDGIYKTEINNINWIKIYPPDVNTEFKKILSINNILIASSSLQIIKSMDYGNTWSVLYNSTFNKPINTIASSPEFLFASIGNTGLIKRAVTDLIVVNEFNTVITGNYELNQNYPNPFNPSTKISYSIKKSSNIELKLFDINGRMIKILESGFKPAGSYEINFNSEGLSSGVYFYTLYAEGIIIDTKKAVVLK